MIKPNFYQQCDTKYAKYRWRGATVCRNGCGPSAIANAVSVLPKLKHPKATPLSVFKWVCNHGYMHPTYGTYYSGIKATLKAYGVKKVIHTSNMSTLKKHLKKGDMAICLTGKSRWTQSGHYILAYGMKGDDVLISDSASTASNRMRAPFNVLKQAIKAHPYPQVWIIDNTAQYLEEKKETKLKGFDVSYAQNGLTQKDFEKAKKAGWDFVILRLGTVLNGSYYTDQEFELKYKKAIASGLKVGIYWYTMAKSVADAKKEANYVVKVLKGRKLTYPVFYDIEDARQNDLGKSLNKKMCEAFCKVIEDAGYSAGVYASTNWLTNKIDTISKKYYVWVAQYNSTCTYKGRYEMWQYSSTKEVSGIGKKIDVNISEIKPSVYPVKKSEPKKEEPKKEVKKKKRVYPEIPKKGFFKLGDKGTNVKRLQTLLNKAGFNCGKVDGVYGEKTVSAVKRLQKKYGIKQDGLYGKKTHEALKKALK